MSTFGTLYRFECRKLLKRKIVKISLALCLLLAVLTVIIDCVGDAYIDGRRVESKYQMQRRDRAYARALDGEKIDQSLLEKMTEAYRKIPYTVEKHYTGTAEYQKYARPYSDIFSFVRGSAEFTDSEIILSWEPDEEELYRRREEVLEKDWKLLGLSEGEKEFWRRRDAALEKPFTYRSYDGYYQLFRCYQTISLLVLLVISVSLASLFSSEHTAKTDQLILSSAKGKTSLYFAKLLAGISFALGCAALFLIVTCGLNFALYGADGFWAPFQMIVKNSSETITCGQAWLIACGALLAASAVVGVFVMLLSEAFGSSLAALAVSVGFLFLSMVVMVPEQYRAAAQIWNSLPWNFITVWNLFSKYTVSVFGKYVTSWQAVPVLYLLAGAVLGAAGKRIYRSFQVSGR